MSTHLSTQSRFRNALIVVAISALAVSACGGEESSRATTPDDAEFVVSVGDEFTIVLEANVTTGFSWELKQPLDESILTHVDDDYVAPG